MTEQQQPEPDQHPRFLGGLSCQEFLTKHWQKQPLFVRNGFPEWAHCLSPDELAGFALEEAVESRILIERRDGHWDLEHGPFPEAMFAELPEQHWTLLIQAIDHYVPEFAVLLDQFGFLPQWRIDDLMMSYAATGGSVGPHYDYYDVFLIQISGQRHWQIGARCDDRSPLIPGLPVRILENFSCENEWITEPGDVLYLPPGMAHQGVALDDDCMTLSVGFRAPSYADLISEYSHYLAGQLEGSDRYQDPDIEARSARGRHGGLLLPEDVERFATRLNTILADRHSLSRCLAGYLSQPKYDDVSPQPCELSDTEIRQLLTQDNYLQRDENSRFIWSPADDEPLFINGEQHHFPASARTLAEAITRQRRLSCKTLMGSANDPAAIDWLTDLIRQGLLYFHER